MGNYTWYWGFEIFNSDPTRVSSPAARLPAAGHGRPADGRRDAHDQHDRPRHDPGRDHRRSRHGRPHLRSLFYYNGYNAPDRGHGHGIYAQNLGSTPKQIYDNIIFQQFGWGIHAYAEGGHLDNFDFQGNISFNNGGLSGRLARQHPRRRHAESATNPKLISNYTYNTDHTNINDLGYDAGCTSPDSHQQLLRPAGGP